MAEKNGKERFQQSSQRIFTIMEAASFLRISRASLFRLINKGIIQTFKISTRMTRITLDELLRLAKASGLEVITDETPSFPLSHDTRERKEDMLANKPETGRVNKTAKCRKTPKAGEKAPEGVTHDTHYTMGEVLGKFAIKYGRFYEVRNRYQLKSIHAWGTTCFRKEDVEDAIARYNEEQGRAQREAYYTCFDIMQKFGLGKTQVRRFAEIHGVRIKKAKGGRANLYLKADWDAARKKAEAKRKYTKAQREGL